MVTDELLKHTPAYAEFNRELDKKQREREGRKSIPPSAPKLEVAGAAEAPLTHDRAKALVKALLSNHNVMTLVPLIQVEGGLNMSHAEFGTLLRAGVKALVK